MRSYDVVAWADTEHGAVVCLDCTSPGEADGKEWSPVFAGSEWDSFPSCDRCREAVYDVALTPDGVEYHKEWLYGAGGEMPAAEADALVATATPLIQALGDCGVHVGEVVRYHGDGQAFVMYVPEGYACLPGEHDFDTSGECVTCGEAG